MIIVRPLQGESKAQLAAMLNRNLALDRLPARVLAHTAWGDPDFQADLALVAEVDGTPAGFLLGVVRNGETGFLKVIAVEQNYRNQGVGSNLLAEMERRFARLGVREIRLGESAPNYLWPGLDVGYTGAMVFFERHGFKRFGETFNLNVDLTAIKPTDQSSLAGLAARGIVISRARESDWRDCDALVSRHWPGWKDEVPVAFENHPVSLHLARRGSQLIGFAAYDCNNPGTGWFGPMGTLPEARKLGIGRTLLACCLADIAGQGLTRATIPWVGPVRFYNKAAGAVVSRVFYRYRKGSFA